MIVRLRSLGCGILAPHEPDRSKRIIILTADAGFGHRKAANALAAALQEAYGDACSADVVNPLDDRRVLPLLRNSQADSDRFSRDMREIFDRGWNASRAAVPAASLGGALTVALFNVMRDILRTYRPDAIINTYPLYHPPLASVFALTRRRTPLYTVVTDFGVVHSLWFSRAAAACFVATEKVRQLAIAHGLPPEKVHITGIPVAPRWRTDPATRPRCGRRWGGRSTCRLCWWSAVNGCRVCPISCGS